MASIPPHVVALTGPRLLGYLLHWGLFGILLVQVYLYYLAFPNDPLRNKLLVYVVFALEITQTVIMTNTAFRVFGFGYGDFDAFNDVELAWFEVPVICGVVAFIAQLFYAHRIKVLSRSYWVAGVILLLAVVQLGGAIASAVVLKDAVVFSHLLGRAYSISAGIWNGGSAACDAIIAICMTYYLSSRGNGIMQSTHVRLRKVIRLVIETGTVTAAVAILNLILILLPGQPSYYLVTSEILAKVYSNSMMVVLNSRMRIGPEAANDSLTTAQRHRSVFTGVTGGGMHQTTDQYELGEGVMITREEVVFPSGKETRKSSPADDKHYFVA
ncbi:hypothetical protein D9613_008945 [Agrocybe pediades]|uniref:DUF6534 domain-containing protein n=1 Tax=Agrocybe pediades TaxID=84607 RepID=A0A8H4QSI9_9AGAR|nr:hypothetical protein D9613_008945 [Agrocybe pediades]KAF9549387.1 hypothetical protein CPC08DRAFT_729363 [Agrocybe pediades]